MFDDPWLPREIGLDGVGGSFWLTGKWRRAMGVIKRRGVSWVGLSFAAYSQVLY